MTAGLYLANYMEKRYTSILAEWETGNHYARKQWVLPINLCQQVTDL